MTIPELNLTLGTFIGHWFNLGKTIAFTSHSRAYEYFNFSAAGGWPKNLTNVTTANEWMCVLAARQGYDSIQFLVDPSVPRDCGWNKHYLNLGYEIVSTRLVGKHACASESGMSPLIRSGWQGSNNCTCDNNIPRLNCAEVQHPATFPKPEPTPSCIGKHVLHGLGCACNHSWTCASNFCVNEKCAEKPALAKRRYHVRD